MIPSTPPSHNPPRGHPRYYDKSRELTEVRLVMSNIEFAIQNVMAVAAQAATSADVKEDPDHADIINSLRRALQELKQWTGSKDVY